MRRFTALLLFAACTSTAVPVGDGLRVLFLGNSLTYTNDLPGLVRRLGAADGIVIETRDESQADFALEDHWNRAASRGALAEGGWDAVILQQGPSSLAASRVSLITWARTWADAVRAQGGTPALYMVWPDRSRLAFFDDVSLSYRLAADSANAALYPAGEAWRAAWTRSPSLALYGPDDFHPSVMGSYLAALTIYRGLTGRTPPSLTDLGIPPAVDSLLQAAASEAVANFGSSAAGSAPSPHRTRAASFGLP